MKNCINCYDSKDVTLHYSVKMYINYIQENVIFKSFLKKEKQQKHWLQYSNTIFGHIKIIVQIHSKLI
jgi:hypothetical protein